MIGPQPCIICDIDNVLTDSRVWEKYIPTDKTSRSGWDNFNMHYHLCRPNRPMIEKICEFNGNIPIVFMTSREDKGVLRSATIQQLKRFSENRLTDFEFYNKLLMRPENCYDPSDIMKEALLNKHILSSNLNPLLAIDDDEANIRMFQRYGIFAIKYEMDNDGTYCTTK